MLRSGSRVGTRARLLGARYLLLSPRRVVIECGVWGWGKGVRRVAMLGMMEVRWQVVLVVCREPVGWGSDWGLAAVVVAVDVAAGARPRTWACRGGRRKGLRFGGGGVSFGRGRCGWSGRCGIWERGGAGVGLLWGLMALVCVSVVVSLWKGLVRLTALCNLSRGQDVRGEVETAGLSLGEDAAEVLELELRQLSEVLYAYLYCCCVCCPERSL